MDDSEIAYNSDQDVSEHHSKLLKAVAQLDKGQRVKKAERSEPTLEVSEYHLVKSGITDKDAVHIQDLAKSLGRKGYQSEIIKKLRSAQQKTKVLPKPLEKPVAQKIKRIIGFQNTKKELGKWNAIIAKNRTADHLFFPLNILKETLKTTATTEFLKRFRVKSDLQNKLEELDPTPKEPPTEEKNKSQPSLKKVIQRRKEAARIRAQQSYKAAKAYRQGKIKSKKFHRVQRKQNIKQQLKEFEELKKKNPEDALIKLQQLDKSRAKERMSLRHKNTGQWAKNKQIKAKYDKEIRQVLAEQLSIGRDLTQKLKQSDNSDDEEKKSNNKNKPLVFSDEEEEPLVISEEDKKNLLLNTVNTESEMDEFIKSCLKYKEKSKKLQEEKVAKVECEPKPPVKDFTLDKKLKKQISDGPNKIDDTVIFANQKTQESVETKKISKKVSKKANTRCTVVSDEIVSGEKRVRLSDKKKQAKRKVEYDADATTVRQDEECEEMNSKTAKLADIDDMFDSMEEKFKHKVDLELEKIKKKLKESKVKKQRKKDKATKDYTPNLEFKKTKQRPILDQPLEEITSGENLQQDTDRTNLKALTSTEQELIDKSGSDEEGLPWQKPIEPKHFNTQLPDVHVDDEDAMENSEQEEEPHSVIGETFAGDDVEEFRKEKQEEIKKSQPEDIDRYLPGWGSWAGENIKKSKINRKRKRFILKFPKDAPRKDENKGDVIIFEGDNKKLKEHLVNELPYPFTTVKDFEASIRAPLGRTFVPENAHTRLIQPTVNIKIGKVIDPMTEDVLVKKQPTLKRRIDNKKDAVKNIKKNNKRKCK